jgi:hypothetical protein
MEPSSFRALHEHKVVVNQGLLALAQAKRASWHVNSEGKLELRLVSGEVYQIDRQTVTRMA